MVYVKVIVSEARVIETKERFVNLGRIFVSDCDSSEHTVTVLVTLGGGAYTQRVTIIYIIISLTLSRYTR